MLLKTSAILLVVWGLTVALGELIGAFLIHTPWLGVVIVVFAGLVAAGGVGLWRGRTWGLALAAIGLLGPIVVDWVRAVHLSEGERIRLGLHVIHLLVAVALLTAAWAGLRRLRAKPPGAPS